VKCKAFFLAETSLKLQGTSSVGKSGVACHTRSYRALALRLWAGWGPRRRL